MKKPTGIAPSSSRRQYPKKNARTKTVGVSAKQVEYKVVNIDPLKKVYVHIKDPDNQDALLRLKQTCGEFPGVSDIVLVLGEDKKSAIKLPFKVDGSDALIDELVRILGEDAVALK